MPLNSELLIRASSHLALSAVLAASLWRRAGLPSAAAAVVAAAFWLALEWSTGDARLLFPFAMGCAGAAAWRWSWTGAAAAALLFLAARSLAGAPSSVLQTEILGTILCLSAALAVRRAGPAASAAAGSMAGLAALLL